MQSFIMIYKQFCQLNSKKTEIKKNPQNTLKKFPALYPKYFTLNVSHFADIF